MGGGGGEGLHINYLIISTLNEPRHRNYVLYIYIIYIHVEESCFFALALMARYCFVVAWLL